MKGDGDSDNDNPAWYCYILRNGCEKDKGRTYNGYTNRPARRIRQHNGDLVGGAKYTKRYGNNSWEMYVLIKGFPTSQNAMQCEWRIKHPNNRRRRSSKYFSPVGRIEGLNRILKSKRWTSRSNIENDMIDLEIWIVEEYAHLLTDLPDNFKVHVVDKIDLTQV